MPILARSEIITGRLIDSFLNGITIEYVKAFVDRSTGFFIFLMPHLITRRKKR